MRKIGISFLCAFILSNLWAQEEVRSGKIVYVPEFAIWGTVGDGQANAVFGLKTDSVTYVLTSDSVFLFGNGNFEIAGQVCSIGDSVEFSGYIHSVSDDHKAFHAFEIVTISKLISFPQERISGVYTGILDIMPNPASTNPCLPGMVMGLDHNRKQYVLADKHWFWNEYMEIDGTLYEVGDSVEIKGVLSTHIDLLNRTYYELEIDTIRKIERSVEDTTGNWTLREIGNICYNAVNQILVIDGNVKIERIEVMDVRGRCVLHETHPIGSVSVAHLPRGLYLYRLTTPATTQSGKFVL